jgi:hypothetical protein
MTRNIYLGGNIFELAQARSPQEVPVVAARLYATVRATNFPERAKALALEIETARPALVGLQEVSLYRLRTRAASVPPPPRAREKPVGG